jgi:hypothetical protein
MNEIEQECIILNSVWEMIDGMVNWAMFVKHDRTEPTNMMFETSQHNRLFIILLGDFLSQLRVFKGQPIPLGLSPAPSNARADIPPLVIAGLDPAIHEDIQQGWIYVRLSPPAMHHGCPGQARA